MIATETHRSPMIVIEPSFRRHMLRLSPNEQEQCFRAVDWFEGRRDESERHKKSERVEGCSRRRLRVVKASGDLRLICAESNAGHNWLWAGRLDDLDAAAKRLDVAAIESPVEVELRHLLSGPVPPPPESESSLLPQREVDDWLEKIDSMTLYTSESATILARIKAKRLATDAGTVQELQVAKTEVAALRSEADALRNRLEALEKDRKPAPSTQTIGLSLYNETRAERDRLADRLKKAEKRASLNTFTGSQVEQVKKMADEELRIVKREGEKLRTELAAARASVNKNESAVLSEKAKDDLRDRCAKVCDDQANVLGRTERKDLQDQAEELRRLATKIRALK